MKPLFDDTHPKIEAMYIAGIRAMTFTQKLRRVREMNRFGYQLVLSDVREKFPDASEREQLLRVAARYYGAELVRKATGFDVDAKR